MTNDSIPRDAWHTTRDVADEKQRHYTSNDHPGWSIHDTGNGGPLTIDYGNATVATRDSLAAALEWVEAIPANWTAEPGPCAGTTYYKNSFYSTWTVYDAGPDYGVRVYHHGERVAEEATVLDGIQQVEHSGEIPIRRREDAPMLFGGRGKSATTGPREIPAEELKALTTVEVTERGMRLAIQFLGDALTGPVADVPRKVNRAITLLSLLTGDTTDRTCTAVKQMAVSDQIAAAARFRLGELVQRVDEITEKRS